MNIQRLSKILYYNLLNRFDLRLNRYRNYDLVHFPIVQLNFIGRTEFGNCVDVGSGMRPFPYAQTIIDKYDSLTKHRYGQLRILPHQSFIRADIECLPFKDNQFDFSFCSHVLEHVNDPLRACRELMRISSAGYIETPRIGKDALLASDTTAHKWLVHDVNNTLVFMPNERYLRQGIGDGVVSHMLSMLWYHPIQPAFYEHHQALNVMFKWESCFDVKIIT